MEESFMEGRFPPPSLPGDTHRLYHMNMNPYGHRVLLIFEAKQVPYELVKLDPMRVPDWFSKLTNAKVPILELPGCKQILFESLVICDYLEHQFGDRLSVISREAYAKAQDNMLIRRFNELIRGCSILVDTNFSSGSKQIMQTLDIFEEELVCRGTKYFGGEIPGMLDYMIWPWIEHLYLLSCVDATKFRAKRSLFPNFAAWADLMQEDNIVKMHAHTPEEYYEYHRVSFAHSMWYYL